METICLGITTRRGVQTGDDFVREHDHSISMALPWQNDLTGNPPATRPRSQNENSAMGPVSPRKRWSQRPWERRSYGAITLNIAHQERNTISTKPAHYHLPHTPRNPLINSDTY